MSLDVSFLFHHSLLLLCCFTQFHSVCSCETFECSKCELWILCGSVNFFILPSWLFLCNYDTRGCKATRISWFAMSKICISISFKIHPLWHALWTKEHRWSSVPEIVLKLCFVIVFCLNSTPRTKRKTKICHGLVICQRDVYHQSRHIGGLSQ